MANDGLLALLEYAHAVLDRNACPPTLEAENLNLHRIGENFK
jgi:hypothetical protein